MNKNRRLFALVAVAGMVAAGSAQAWSINFGGGERIKGSGELGTEVRELGAFDGVSTAGDFKIIVRQAASNRVELKIDKNLLPYIETKVVEGSKGRTLEVSTKNGFNISTRNTPELVLDMPTLRSIALSGSGDVKVGAMKTAEVSASISGSGNIVFDNLSSDKLGLSVSGSGDVTAAGRTNSLKISIAGSGDVKTKALAADEVKVSIAGSGDASVQAVKSLHVSIAGSGDVAYVGSPEISTSVVGGGRVKKLDQ
ncbi:head GIN domain-containing protein [Paucibacter sp. R3-3]|uniref:Head GIN domain-containing protein n=1 Tax=Roseateles agri TaxID=3098619 RepID=A0ABU5DBF7_9BURK|nr:head GIN domain-containing protein [Paucibacter sp. R3-3]MDY0743590.1 head GIN domain-containing protein [Paucibacter sp. R3-3]